MSMDRKIEKKKWPPRKIAIVGAAVLFFSFLLYSFIWGDSSSKLNVKSERITISEVKRGPFQEFIPVTGTVQPIKTIFLDAIEGGKVDTVFRKAGSFVQTGDKILRLANTSLLISISNQDALVVEQRNLLTNTKFQLERNRIQNRQRILELEYNIQRLKRQYERNKALREKNLVSEAEFEAIEDEYKYQVRLNNLTIAAVRSDSVFQEIQVGQLESSWQRLQDNLQIARRRLDELVIRAPITGQLTSLNAEIGESKSQGQRLGQIDVIDNFKVVAAIDEHYLPRVEIGQRGEFDFAGQTYQLQTAKIYPEIRDGRFDVDMEFDGKEPDGIRRGQTVHIRLQFSGLTDQVLLSLGGFYQKTGGQWVYVLDASGDFATKRRIRLGRKNTQVFEVLEGLEPGEKVITSSYDNFGDIDKLILE
ncbi:MAG: HlyD family efflux transporter periplasmic adaptor subunit [Deferribacteres bacterium]|nr:HlyD family efflux transporter periplasmic adaptor subunit [candidate division KSB1 bacterium]MCB9509361.1 HlyD family efflux transporter periplasmic adaptor subunit [Deferribacteres bacterium]